MQIAVSEAKAQLTDLVRRAQAGDDVVLTRHGRPTVRLVPVDANPAEAEKRAAIEAIRARVAERAVFRPADRSHDWLYDDDGLPA